MKTSWSQDSPFGVLATSYDANWPSLTSRVLKHRGPVLIDRHHMRVAMPTCLIHQVCFVTVVGLGGALQM